MSLNFDELYYRKMSKLISWRNRYPKEQYSSKVVLNLFYEVYPTNLMWGDISNFFSRSFKLFDKDKFDNFSSAFNHAFSVFRQFQIQEVHKNILILMDTNNIVGNIDFSKLKSLSNDANKGSNEAVENVEYTYVFDNIINELILRWAALGLMGLDKLRAFEELTGMILGGIDFGDLKNTSISFGQPVGIYLSGATRDDLGAYKPLPDLW